MMMVQKQNKVNIFNEYFIKEPLSKLDVRYTQLGFINLIDM